MPLKAVSRRLILIRQLMDSFQTFEGLGWTDKHFLLSAPELIPQRRWVVKAQFCFDQLPAFGNIFFLTRHFEVVDVDRHKLVSGFGEQSSIPTLRWVRNPLLADFCGRAFPKIIQTMGAHRVPVASGRRGGGILPTMQVVDLQER